MGTLRRVGKAAKEYTCCECLQPIRPPEQYERVALTTKNKLTTYHTCMICAAIRDSYFEGTPVYGELKSRMEAEGIDLFILKEAHHDL
jgi:RNase P subunit RPR2